jgi:hypothetical protein
MIKSRRMCWIHVAHVGKVRKAYELPVGEPEWERPLGRPRHRWADIRLNLRKMMGQHGLDSCSSGLGPVNALVDMVKNIQVP